MTCGRAQGFLAQNRIAVATVVDAKKERLPAREALKIARAAEEIFVSKGKKTVRIDLRKEKPSDEDLLKLILGPSGNLRAPTLRRGKRLLVGFDAESYGTVLR